MTSLDLKSILLDAEQNGAYFFADTDSKALHAAAKSVGLTLCDMSLAGATDKVELMERLAEGLSIPSWFGGTWDGLTDVFRDLSWLDLQEGFLLVIRDAGELRDGAPEEFDTFLEVANDAAFTWADDGKPFWVIFLMPENELPAVED